MMRHIFLFLLLIPSISICAQLQESDIRYLGSFKIPLTSSSGKSYKYGAWGMGHYLDPVHGSSLYIRGHYTDGGSVGQLSIPSTLSMSDYASLTQATEIQPLTDITDGIGSTGLFTGSTEWEFYGMMPYDGRLILGATTDYIVGAGQIATHAASGFNLSIPNDFTGYESYGGSGYSSRFIGGYMATIPADKQSLFGGAKAVTGGVGHSIVSTTSLGPALSLFDPKLIANAASPHPVNTILYYSSNEGTGLSSSCPGTGMCEDAIFNANSVVGGVAIPSGYDSVIFIGTHDISHGQGFCYSTAECCSSDLMCDSSGFSVSGPYHGYNASVCTDGKGEHSASMKSVIWKYSISDLADVYNGTKTPHDPVPQLWTSALSAVNNGAVCAHTIKGVAYDDSTKRLYIAAGSDPQVYVFSVGESVPTPSSGFRPWAISGRSIAPSGRPIAQ